VIVPFVDIGKIIDHYCLNFIFIRLCATENIAIKCLKYKYEYQSVAIFSPNWFKNSLPLPKGNQKS
jgi:hypothetical protein